MNVSEAILTRQTVRGFKKDPVSQELIKKIFTLAQHSASNCNTQPWHVALASGTTRDELQNRMLAEIASGKAVSPAFQPGNQDLTDIYRNRQVDCAARYYGVMEIAREDKQARSNLMLKNWEFFGAPHVAFISMPKTMGAVNSLDLGIYLQSLMLLMVENGLGSCPQGALALYPDPVFDLCDIPQENGILCGLSFGYPDDNAKINQVQMGRAPLEESVTFN